MAGFRLIFRRSAARDLHRIPKRDVARILSRIRALTTEPRPRGVEKLVGQQQRYRLRQGRYRIIYEIQDEELLIVVVRVGHRRDVYRDG